MMLEIPDLMAFLSPVAALVPPPVAAGIHPLHTLTSDISLSESLSDMPAAMEEAVVGIAGVAIITALSKAGATTVELVALSREAEHLAEEGVSTVTRAAEAITAIAGSCARDLLALLITTPLNPGTGAAAAQIAWGHAAQAARRLMVLESELDALASQLDKVGDSSPNAPQSPLSHGAPSESGVPTAPGGSPDSSANTGEIIGAPTSQAAQAVTAAKSALGARYLWGGTEPDTGVDCSGLTQWAYGQAGVELPRTAEAQAVGPQVPLDQIAPGDLAVWDGHVAMVAENGTMIEAGDPVQISPVRTENIGMDFHGFYRPTA